MESKGKKETNVGHRSEKVRNLLGDIPPTLVTWGYAIIIAIILALILVICFIPYPHSKGESILQHWIYF